MHFAFEQLKRTKNVKLHTNLKQKKNKYGVKYSGICLEAGKL